MKVLIVGSGGREHAITWACSRSRIRPIITCAPGNGGTATIARNVPIPAENIADLEEFIRSERFDLIVIGPEAPMVLGLADRLTSRGYRVFGPSASAARIEGSKAFSKNLMMKAGIPTAAFETFIDFATAENYIRSQGAPIVVKASGLAAGKGAVVCKSMNEAIQTARSMLADGTLGEAGREIVVEEFLEGVEVSLTAIVDGTDYLLLPPSRDHKAVFDGGKGPNTGGMGAVSPLDNDTNERYRKAANTVLKPLLQTLANEGSPFRGAIYPGLMVTDNDVKVLEVNARFGDPETEALLPLLNFDLLEVMAETAEGNLASWMKRNDLAQNDWKAVAKPGAAATVILASQGYPNSYPKGLEITGIPDEEDDLIVFQAGTKLDGRRLVTAGGRVLSVTGLGSSLDTAIEKAYSEVGKIKFDGMHFRRDIGRSVL